MSCNLERLQSASSLRDWEEGRAKRFVSWKDNVESLIAGLRTTSGLGVMQQQHIEEFLRRRCAADHAYAQALAAPSLPPPSAPPAAGSKAQAAAPPDKAAVVGAAATPFNAQASLFLCDPLCRAISDIQIQMSAAREAFATDLLEGAVLSGLAQATGDFEKTSDTMLQGLDSGLVQAVEANAEAVDAMTAYHMNSIEGSREDPPCDAWLFEHRYRRAVEFLRERQRSFTIQLCAAVEEVWRLEEWREEMSRKVLGRFCNKLHQVETSVQSFANDAIRALASHKKEESPSVAILAGLEQLLRSSPLPPVSRPFSPVSQQPAQQKPALSSATAVVVQGRPKPGEWPMLLRLRREGQLGPLPASVLSICRGPLQAPRRWYGTQLSMMVLTKDFWLHCFYINTDKAASASSTSSGAGGSIDGLALEAVEAEPSWSLYIPSTSVTLTSGKTRSIEVEEIKRGFLGIKSTRRESFQADDDASCQRWLATLQQASRKSAQPALQARPPPPPPPPSRPEPEVAATPPPKSSGALAPPDSPEIAAPKTLAALLEPMAAKEDVFGI